MDLGNCSFNASHFGQDLESGCTKLAIVKKYVSGETPIYSDYKHEDVFNY